MASRGWSDLLDDLAEGWEAQLADLLEDEAPGMGDMEAAAAAGPVGEAALVHQA